MPSQDVQPTPELQPPASMTATRGFARALTRRASAFVPAGPQGAASIGTRGRDAVSLAQALTTRARFSLTQGRNDWLAAFLSRHLSGDWPFDTPSLYYLHWRRAQFGGEAGTEYSGLGFASPTRPQTAKLFAAELARSRGASAHTRSPMPVPMQGQEWARRGHADHRAVKETALTSAPERTFSRRSVPLGPDTLKATRPLPSVLQLHHATAQTVFSGLPEQTPIRSAFPERLAEAVAQRATPPSRRSTVALPEQERAELPMALSYPAVPLVSWLGQAAPAPEQVDRESTPGFARPIFSPAGSHVLVLPNLSAEPLPPPVFERPSQTAFAALPRLSSPSAARYAAETASEAVVAARSAATQPLRPSLEKRSAASPVGMRSAPAISTEQAGTEQASDGGDAHPASARRPSLRAARSALELAQHLASAETWTVLARTIFAHRRTPFALESTPVWARETSASELALPRLRRAVLTASALGEGRTASLPRNQKTWPSVIRHPQLSMVDAGGWPEASLQTRSAGTSGSLKAATPSSIPLFLSRLTAQRSQQTSVAVDVTPDMSTDAQTVEPATEQAASFRGDLHPPRGVRPTGRQTPHLVASAPTAPFSASVSNQATHSLAPRLGEVPARGRTWATPASPIFSLPSLGTSRQAPFVALALAQAQRALDTSAPPFSASIENMAPFKGARSFRHMTSADLARLSSSTSTDPRFGVVPARGRDGTISTSPALSLLSTGVRTALRAGDDDRRMVAVSPQPTPLIQLAQARHFIKPRGSRHSDVPGQTLPGLSTTRGAAHPHHSSVSIETLGMGRLVPSRTGVSLATHPSRLPIEATPFSGSPNSVRLSLPQIRQTGRVSASPADDQFYSISPVPPVSINQTGAGPATRTLLSDLAGRLAYYHGASGRVPAVPLQSPVGAAHRVAFTALNLATKVKGLASAHELSSLRESWVGRPESGGATDGPAVTGQAGGFRSGWLPRLSGRADEFVRRKEIQSSTAAQQESGAPSVSVPNNARFGAANGTIPLLMAPLLRRLASGRRQHAVDGQAIEARAVRSVDAGQLATSPSLFSPGSAGRLPLFQPGGHAAGHISEDGATPPTPGAVPWPTGAWLPPLSLRRSDARTDAGLAARPHTPAHDLRGRLRTPLSLPFREAWHRQAVTEEWGPERPGSLLSVNMPEMVPTVGGNDVRQGVSTVLPSRLSARRFLDRWLPALSGNLTLPSLTPNVMPTGQSVAVSPTSTWAPGVIPFSLRADERSVSEAGHREVPEAFGRGGTLPPAPASEGRLPFLSPVWLTRLLHPRLREGNAPAWASPASSAMVTRPERFKRRPTGGSSAPSDYTLSGPEGDGGTDDIFAEAVGEAASRTFRSQLMLPLREFLLANLSRVFAAFETAETPTLADNAASPESGRSFRPITSADLAWLPNPPGQGFRQGIDTDSVGMAPALPLLSLPSIGMRTAFEEQNGPSRERQRRNPAATGVSRIPWRVDTAAARTLMPRLPGQSPSPTDGTAPPAPLPIAGRRGVPALSMASAALPRDTQTRAGQQQEVPQPPPLDSLLAQSFRLTPPSLSLPQRPVVLRQASDDLDRVSDVRTLAHELASLPHRSDPRPIQGDRMQTLSPAGRAHSSLSAQAPAMPLPGRQAVQDGHGMGTMHDPLLIQRAVSGAVTAPSRSGQGGHGSDAADGQAGEGGADVQELAKEVWSHLRRRLANEAARAGR